MIIRKFRGKDLDEIQNRIIEELGPFSVILYTHEIQPGLLQGLLYGAEYEITAGVKPEELQKHLQDAAAGVSPLPIPSSPPSTTPFYSEDEYNIRVTGPISFEFDQPQKIFFIGPDNMDKIVASIKCALKWTKETSHKVALGVVGPFKAEDEVTIKSLSSKFSIPYEHHLSEIPNEVQHTLQIIILSDQLNEQTKQRLLASQENARILLIFDTSTQPDQQLDAIASLESFNLVGIIYIKHEENPSLLFLEKIFRGSSAPVCYFIDSSEVVTVTEDYLYTRILNEKLSRLT